MNQEDCQKFVRTIHDGRTEEQPVASVVIVIYNTNEDILDLLASLQEQETQGFEIIIVNNGRIKEEIIAELLGKQLLYIENSKNSVSLGRNLGTIYARGDIVIFLDDDCLAHADLVGAHLRCFEDENILAANGKALAKQRALYHHFQSHYDLGDQVATAVIRLEGNCSVRKEVLFAVGGFDPELFGAEGLDLTYKIVNKYGRRDAIIYTPEAIIYHDFADGLINYLEKCYRQPRMRTKLAKEFPDIIKFAREYGPYPQVCQAYSSLLEKIVVKIIGRMGVLAEKLGRTIQ